MSEKQEWKPPLSDDELDGIYRMLCREGGSVDGGPQYFEGRPVYPMWSTIKEETERLLHGSFCGVIKEDPPRVLDGSKWMDAPA